MVDDEQIKFVKMLYDAYQKSNGDLYTFWAALNPDAEIQRTSEARKVFIFCNKRKKISTGEEFIKHVIKLDDICYDTTFKTVTIPKFNGYLELKDYIIDKPHKTLTIFKYEFLASKNAALPVDKREPF